MKHIPKLRVEVVAGAVPTPFVEQGPEGFDMKGDTITRRDCLTHIVSGQAIRKIELVIEPGFGSVAKCLGCQAKGSEGSEIIGLDPVHDPRANFLWCSRRIVVHLSLEGRRLARELDAQEMETSHRRVAYVLHKPYGQSHGHASRVRVLRGWDGDFNFHAHRSSAKPTLTFVSRLAAVS